MPTRQKILLGILGAVVVLFLYMTYFTEPPTPNLAGGAGSTIGKPPTAQAQRSAARVADAARANQPAPVQNIKTIVEFKGAW